MLRREATVISLSTSDVLTFDDDRAERLAAAAVAVKSASSNKRRMGINSNTSNSSAAMNSPASPKLTLRSTRHTSSPISPATHPTSPYRTSSHRDLSSLARDDHSSFVDRDVSFSAQLQHHQQQLAQQRSRLPSATLSFSPASSSTVSSTMSAHASSPIATTSTPTGFSPVLPASAVLSSRSDVEAPYTPTMPTSSRSAGNVLSSVPSSAFR
ncbi:hypothetical protein V1511DRAFT_504115 [Dipodascopsis uninucleata]